MTNPLRPTLYLGTLATQALDKNAAEGAVGVGEEGDVSKTNYGLYSGRKD